MAKCGPGNTFSRLLLRRTTKIYQRCIKRGLSELEKTVKVITASLLFSLSAPTLSFVF